MFFQIILLIILLCALLLTWRRAWQRAIRYVEAIGWSVVWIAAGIAVFRPEVTTTVAHFFGVGRGVDLAIYASVVVLFFLVFHLHVAHDRLERQLSALVEQQALQELEAIVEQEKNLL